MLLSVILASVAISVVSFIGVFVISLNGRLLKRSIYLLVALAAGTLIGNAFFSLLPESVELLPARTAFGIVLASFVIFFLTEKLLRWHHCHDEKHEHHTVGTMNLIGDAVHNFTDGLVIAGAFAASFPLGVTTTVAIALHEIPQEFGDFGVLVHSGYSRGKALMLNFMVALGALAGAVVGYFLIVSVPAIEAYLVPFAAGGFLYIAAVDLVPEIREQENMKKLAYSFSIFLFGIFMMYLLQENFGHGHGDAAHESEHLQEEIHDEELHLEEHSEFESELDEEKHE